VIPADLGAELTSAIRTAIAAGDLPAAAASMSSSGTWRPAPAAAARPAVPERLPGSYATSLPFDLARLAGAQPAAVAARLAELIRPASWIDSAEPTGGGYLTIKVTAAALADLAVRIAEAGPACARSAALRGVRRPAPPVPDLAAEPSWQQAWRDQAAALVSRLAEAAGATVEGTAAEAPAAEAPGGAGRDVVAGRGGATGRGPAGQLRLAGWPVAAGGMSVADAVGYAGADAVRYWLARMPAGLGDGLDGRFSVSYSMTDPYYLVSFAHADAASVLRWAADLGLARVEPDERLAGLLAWPAELALLGRLSWCAERVAGAARRGRPAELPRYLEEVAGAWLACREECPALPFGGGAAPRDAAGISARLWLADAARTVLAAGLGLIGIAPRARL
jgi:arginyl-tRNA synthetase